MKFLEKNLQLGGSTDEIIRCWLHCPKAKQEVDWEDWEKRFEALVAQVRGFNGVSYDEEVEIFKDYIAPTDLTVKIKW